MKEAISAPTTDRTRKKRTPRHREVSESSLDDGRCRAESGPSRGDSVATCVTPHIVGLNRPTSTDKRDKSAVETLSFAATAKHPQGLMIGLDVGSTTVKSVVVDPANDEVLWKDYQRHDGRQPEKTLEMLEGIEAALADVPLGAYRLFSTGSGGADLTEYLGGKFVQEVNAVSLAVEKRYPEVRSVIELGGQDAKIIIFREDEQTGRMQKVLSMNDKCAGGTGAVIDKISAKLGIAPAHMCEMQYRGLRLHPVAGKCGVFAETDINSLQKQGVPNEELLASLFESIIQQNLSVLTRGHTLRPTVLLLGGPNCYVKGMQDCWKRNIALVWTERGVDLPDPSRSPEDYIITPENGEYFAALGAVEYGKMEAADDPDVGLYVGRDRLRWYMDFGRAARKNAAGTGGLAKNDDDLARFKQRYARKPWRPAVYEPEIEVEGFIGLDSGSTSTKAAFIDLHKSVVAKAYRLSKGNPINDAIEILGCLERQLADQGCTPRVLGMGTTGYAKDILKAVLGADVALAETVAHATSGLHFYPNADVIVDVGGQDIKLIMLENGRVKDFRLNTQCSAGNGYLLQSTAAAFGYDVQEYADIALTATAKPEFGYGCAVFMQSDIVDFQRQGWQPNEIMAGLAAAIPKNVWLYVAQIPNLSRLGTKFVLQGGAQRNLAAVKAQVDFIESRFAGTDASPVVIVHEHCGESGAVGCAIEAHRLWTEKGSVTRFIGLEAVKHIQCRTTDNDSTRCRFCSNRCRRTFVDVKMTSPSVRAAEPQQPRERTQRRLIIATCEKGAVEDHAHMRRIRRELDAVKQANPNLVDVAAHEAFKKPEVECVADPIPRPTVPNVLGSKKMRMRRERARGRAELRIGLPRVLSMYSLAPFFTGYFTSLGVRFRNIVWSDYTSEQLYRDGIKRGAIDPCFPSKLAIPHVHNLLTVQNAREPLTHIFFPMVDAFPTFLRGVENSRACPAVVATPEATHAAFVKEGNMFAERNIAFKKTFLNLNEPPLCARQMYQDWRDDLGITLAESQRAVYQGLSALNAYNERMRCRARQIISRLEAEQRLGIVVLARPYHNDPGVNHEVCTELQKLGYPILTQDSLPINSAILEQLFGTTPASGNNADPMTVQDVWKNSYSENTSRKLWAAKYVARHPNLVALELSSFKCGQDAPIYSVIEEIIDQSGTPYFCFKDIDENRSTASIRIRIETIAYFLARYREEMIDDHKNRSETGGELRESERTLHPRAPSVASKRVAI